jgi:hypothetical protein
MHKRHPKLLKLWQKYDLWSLEIDIPRIEITWWASNDKNFRKREGRLVKEIKLPLFLWRPYCWLYGHSPYGYHKDNYCLTCHKYPVK